MAVESFSDLKFGSRILLHHQVDHFKKGGWEWGIDNDFEESTSNLSLISSKIKTSNDLNSTKREK